MQTKAQKTLHFEMNTSRQTFHFNTPLNLDHDGKSMPRITNLEVYNSNFNITDKKRKNYL